MDQNRAESAYYTIEQVATRTQLTKRTLRYYEEMELLPQAERTEGNYRRYTEDDIQRILYIKSLRELLGFSLNEVRKFLQVEDERELIRTAFRQQTDVQEKIAQLDRSDELIHEQLALVEQKITGLEQMRQQLILRLEKHSHKRSILQNS
ncbi:MerR family transcriptional regulator [Dictyobacter alpinus]|nr:MerR family transcriptional regulator [Dictyobacter alpinus]